MPHFATTSIAVAATAAVALGAAGCGGSKSASSEINGTLHTLATALLDGNGQQACNTLTQGAIDEFVANAGSTSATCAQLFHTASGNLSQSVRAQLKRIHFTGPIHIAGDHASAEDSTGGSPDRFVRQNGHWYFESSSFGG